MNDKILFLLIIIGTIANIFLVSLVLGQEVALDSPISTPSDIEEAGIILPDSPLYEVELLFNSITETFSENAKISHARQRLAEVKVMLERNKTVQAEKAIRNFNKINERLINKDELKEHKKLIDNLGQRISAIASMKGSLNETSREEIKRLILEHKESINNETADMILYRNLPPRKLNTRNR